MRRGVGHGVVVGYDGGFAFVFTFMLVLSFGGVCCVVVVVAVCGSVGVVCAVGTVGSTLQCWRAGGCGCSRGCACLAAAAPAGCAACAGASVRRRGEGCGLFGGAVAFALHRSRTMYIPLAISSGRVAGSSGSSSSLRPLPLPRRCSALRHHCHACADRLILILSSRHTITTTITINPLHHHRLLDLPHLRRQLAQLRNQVPWRQVPEQNRIALAVRVGALDKDGRQRARGDLRRRLVPDTMRAWRECDAVRLDVAKKQNLLAAGLVAHEEGGRVGGVGGILLFEVGVLMLLAVAADAAAGTTDTDTGRG